MAISSVKKLFQPLAQPGMTSIGILLVRLVAGAAFMFHGWGKIQNPMSWAGPDSAIPGILLALAAISEFGGGLAWILGLLTPLASFGMACTMVVATHMHMILRGDPFVNMTGGPSYELALLFLTISILFICAGPGKFSLDAKIFGERR